MKAQCLQEGKKTTSKCLPCNTNSFIFWFDIFLIHTFIKTINKSFPHDEIQLNARMKCYLALLQ